MSIWFFSAVVFLLFYIAFDKPKYYEKCNLAMFYCVVF